MTPWLPIAVAWLSGCDHGPDRYAELMAESRCDLYARCGKMDASGYEDEDACLASEREVYGDLWGEETCPDFDHRAAEDCIAAWDALTCEQFENSAQHPECGDVCGPAEDDTGGGHSI